MKDCLFCKIVNKQIPAKIVYEDEEILAFEDIQPQAPVHILLIPKKHIATLNDLETDHQMLIGKLILQAGSLAEQKDVAVPGYRLIINCNQDGGQSVYHLHLHLLAARSLAWPPG